MGSCCAGEGTMAAAAHHYKCALITGQKSRNVPTMTGADSRGTNGFPVPAEAESALQRLRYLGHSLSHLQNKGNVQYKETIQDSHSHILGRRVPRPLVKVQVIDRRGKRQRETSAFPAFSPTSTMVSWLISRLVVLIFGTLYPAYFSYKAVKSKDIKEYVKWMMYWIIFALFMTVETFTDLFLCWFPFYYELKIAFVAWLLSPYTKGSSLLYRKFVHPTLSSKEKEIDECLLQAKDRSYDALVHFGKRGLNVAASAAVTAAAKGQGALSERLRSFSMQDLSSIRGDAPPQSAAPVRTTSKTAKPKLSRSVTQPPEPSATAKSP